VAKQKIALLLLKRFPEFKVETTAYFATAKQYGGPWLQQNAETIDEVLRHLEAR